MDKKFETPEEPKPVQEAPTVFYIHDMKALIKELHNISRELNTLNQILRRKKS